MRIAHQSKVIQFRASDGLTAALRARADRAGVSVSEYLRTIAREKVGLQ